MVSTRGCRRRQEQKVNESSLENSKDPCQSSSPPAAKPKDIGEFPVVVGIQGKETPNLDQTLSGTQKSSIATITRDMVFDPGEHNVSTTDDVCTTAIKMQSGVEEMQEDVQNKLCQLNISCDVSSNQDSENICSGYGEDSFDNSASIEANLSSFHFTKEAGTGHGEYRASKISGILEQPRDNFGWLVKTGRVLTIDPLDTIPLVCVRDVSESGVAKLEFAFLRSANGPGMSMGVSSAAPQPVVVRIPENELHVVVDYFVPVKSLAVENAQAISTSKIWYGIVEGAHRRKALINLGEKVPLRFKGYPWVILCVDWQPLDVLRAFARERNEFQRGEHLVDFTMFDVFKNLKQSADKVALREGLTEGRTTNRGYIKRVADHYCGGTDTANSLSRQLAGIAVVLSWPVIEEMGKLLNRENLEEAKRVAKDTAEEVMEYIDARVCRNLLTKSTLRGATTFKSKTSEADQINVLRRLSYLAPQRDYKVVSKTELESQTKKTLAARGEVKKLERRLGGHSWPADMISARNALLTTTKFDSAVEENERKDGLLPIFQGLWERFFPINVELENAIKTQDQNSRDFAAVESSSESEVGGVEQETLVQDSTTKEKEDIDCVEAIEKDISEGSTTEDQDSELVSGNDEENDVSDESEDNAGKQCPLTQLSVRVFNKGWRDFQRNLLSEDLFDFIFVDPVQSLSAYELKQKQWTEFKDERKIREFANFCRVSLRSGCYVFVIVLAEEFNALCSAFQAEGMKTMKEPFLIIPNTEDVRVTRLKDLPQGCGELAVVAKTPGTCFGFKPDFNRSYSLFGCVFKRKIGVIDNVPRCQNPLRGAKSRSEVRPRERHPDFVSEVIETFCAPTGTVLDISGGALTTAISCISLGRACVALEEDQHCFNLALRRLEKLCRDKLLNPDEVPRTTTRELCEQDDESD